MRRLGLGVLALHVAVNAANARRPVVVGRRPRPARRQPRRPRGATRAAAGETNSGTKVTMHTPPLSAQARRARRRARCAGCRTGRGPRSGRTSPAPRLTSSASRIVSAETWREVDQHARAGSSRAPPREPNGESPPSTGTSVAESAHGDVVVVGQRQVAHAEHVQHPQRAERAVDRVPALGAEQRGDPARATRPRSTSSAVRRERQLGRHTGAVMRCTASTCSSVAVDGRVALQRARARRPTRTGRRRRPSRSRGQVGVGRGSRGGDVEPVEVVAGLLARLPGQVVVPVDERGARRAARGPGRRSSRACGRRPTRHAGQRTRDGH